MNNIQHRISIKYNVFGATTKYYVQEIFNYVATTRYVKTILNYVATKDVS